MLSAHAKWRAGECRQTTLLPLMVWPQATTVVYGFGGQCANVRVVHPLAGFRENSTAEEQTIRYYSSRLKRFRYPGSNQGWIGFAHQCRISTGSTTILGGATTKRSSIASWCGRLPTNRLLEVTAPSNRLALQPTKPSGLSNVAVRFGWRTLVHVRTAPSARSLRMV